LSASHFAIAIMADSRVSAAETATSSGAEDDNDLNSWPPHLRLLYAAKQEVRLGLLEKPGSTGSTVSASPGDMAEIASNQGGDPFCTSTTATGYGIPARSEGAVGLRLCKTISKCLVRRCARPEDLSVDVPHPRTYCNPRLLRHDHRETARNLSLP
jgi:hypothetical protein